MLFFTMKWDKSVQNPPSLYYNYTGKSDQSVVTQKLFIFFVQNR